MVIARLLSEMTVLAALLLLPVAIGLHPALQKLPLAHKILAGCVALCAACLLPLYGLINWVVHLDDKGITARSLLAKRFVPWEHMRKLSLKSSWSWRRYVLNYDGGEISFPIWLGDVKRLVEEIKQRLPEREARGQKSSASTYSQDLFGLAAQIARCAMECLFIAVFWGFALSLSHSKGVSHGDFVLVLVGCIAATVVVGWRIFLMATTPRKVQLDDAGVRLYSFFYERKVGWSQLRGLTPSSFLLPEGLVLKTAKGWYFLSAGLGAIDEMESELKRRLSGS